MIDDTGMGDAGSVPVPTGWLNQYDRPLAAVTQAGGHITHMDMNEPTTSRSGANSIMNYYAHQYDHRHKARDYQRQAQAQRLHSELRRSEARSARSFLRRLVRVAALFL